MQPTVFWKPTEVANFDASEPVVILGFGKMSQVLANFLTTRLATGIDGEAGWPFVVFDLGPSIVKDIPHLLDLKETEETDDILKMQRCHISFTVYCFGFATYELLANILWPSADKFVSQVRASE
nr:K(+) efflux antiporter 3, chloroplastic [Tanacetum cinerariifolium]